MKVTSITKLDEEKSLLEDPAIWKDVGEGRANGIFQLETTSMSQVASRIKPKNERDVSVLISVNRPGVVRAGLLEPFLRRWEGREPVHFDHPMMEDIVGETMGILIWQEQIMKTVRKLAGFSADEADVVRKIMGKMLYDQMKAKKDEFVNGCLNNPEFVEKTPSNTTPRDCAEKIWSSVEASGVYSFNLSHSVAYALISSWEAWVKHYYFPEYITALMETDSGRVNRYVREARSRGIRILPPDINESERKFTLTKSGSIRYGLDSISHVGAGAVQEIIKHRPYASLEDFLDKVSMRRCNKRVITNLIKIGAFDELGDRSELLQLYYDLRKIDEPVPDFTDDKEVWKVEEELVGTFILKDPMEPYIKAIENTALPDPSELDKIETGKTAVVGGRLSKIKEHTTRGGKKMAFTEVEWNDEIFQVTIFPQAYSAYKTLLEEGSPVAMGVVKLERGCHMVTLERLDYLFGEK